MTVRLKSDGGTLAIYDYTGDDNPFTTPLGNLSRLHFHSALAYPGIIDTRTVSVTVPAMIANAKNDVDTTWTTTLFAHGRPGVPYVEGKITSGLGAVVGLCGSVPIQRGPTTAPLAGDANVCFRCVSLGADSTNVVLNAYGLSSSFGGFPAITLGLTVYVLDRLLA